MKSVIKRLLKEYVKAEKKILLVLSELENGDGVCGCDGDEIIKVIHEGEYEEILEPSEKYKVRWV